MATKVFVDLDEEIILAVEKVLKAEGNQIILVVPESAMLVGSLVSLKLLSRQIYKNNKMIVLVTEDRTGLELSKKAGLVSVEKVSDVNGETWKKALALREKFKEDRERLKKKLLSKREEGEDVEIEEEENGAEEVEEKKEGDEGEKGDEFFQGMPEKPRIGGKLIQIAGFPLFAGGDIKENPDLLKEEMPYKSEGEMEEKAEENDEERKKKFPPVVPVPEPSKAQAEEIDKGQHGQVAKPSSAFLGRDLTSVVGADQKRRRRVGGVGGGLIEKVKAFFTEGNVKQKQYILLGLAALIIIFLLGYFVFPRVTIEITLAEAEVPVNEDVRASLVETTIDLEGLTIPAKKVELTKSASKSAPTTGKGQAGDKAEGVATFYNKTLSPIQLNSGTLLTTIGDSTLRYILRENITVPAKPCDDPCPELGTKEGGIQAEKFGEKYNVSGSSRSYTIAGHNSTDVSATSFSNSVAGGTTEEVKEVSQKDFDDLRNGLVEEIQSGLLGELEALVGENQVKLDGSAKFAEPKVTPSHKVGDDTDNLDMTVEIIGSLFVVSEGDLTDMANYLIKQKNKLEGEFEVEDISELQVGTATVNGDIASFNLRLQGNIKANIDEQSIKDQIKGKGFLEAVSIVKSLPDVKETSFDYSPIWMPIKRIPTDNSKITVVFK